MESNLKEKDMGRWKKERHTVYFLKSWFSFHPKLIEKIIQPSVKDEAVHNIQRMNPRTKDAGGIKY